MAASLTADHLYRFFYVGDDETLALQGISLQLNRGEIVAVTGPSGSGKSTLMSCLAGLDEPDGGTVRVDGERLSRRSEEDRARIRGESIGVLYQQNNLIGHLTVAQNVELARQIGSSGDHLRSPEGDKTRRADVLERCGIAHRARHRPAQLSGGELARAGLAVALANDPPIVIADEPTGELDSVTAAGVINLLRDTAAQGSAVLVVTHSDEVAAAADRRIALRDGKIESEEAGRR
ncbi:MAG TPA: ABC transporter ATP-binding protein [Solirubrobacterales bacterium]|nr:ABC transporter ATP-binding protein [Solirubrobacterales bacterium]